MRSTPAAVGAALLLAAVSTLGAATYVVLPDGSGDFPTIQAAIDAAVDGDVIELADGIFRGQGNRNVRLTEALTIQSSSGDPERCIIDCEGEYSSPARGFDISGPSVSRLLKGLTIMHGYQETSAGGAAVMCGSSATFLDCVFSDNSTAWSQNGGGVCCYDCSPTFVGCRFERNLNSGPGGGATVWGLGTPRFEGCVFSENIAGEGGGCLVFYGSAEFSDCIFWRNAGSCGGGLCCTYEATARLDRCTVVDNTGSHGSGVCVDEASTLELSNSIVAFNHGDVGVFCGPAGALATLSCCDIFGNEGGDWVGCIEGQQGMNGNISLDPLFCDWQGGDFHLQIGSPCAPEYNPACGLIGALPVGCGSSPAQETTWGAMKALFRGDGK